MARQMDSITIDKEFEKLGFDNTFISETYKEIIWFAQNIKTDTPFSTLKRLKISSEIETPPKQYSFNILEKSISIFTIDADKDFHEFVTSHGEVYFSQISPYYVAISLASKHRNLEHIIRRFRNAFCHAHVSKTKTETKSEKILIFKDYNGKKQTMAAALTKDSILPLVRKIKDLISEGIEAKAANEVNAPP